MKIGLLWSDTRTVADAVRAAAEHYEKRCGGHVNVCYVHPSALAGGQEIRVQNVRVRPSSHVLRHHFWIGIEEETITPQQLTIWRQ
jgi:hypothetical protein